MSRLMLFPDAVVHDPAVDRWMDAHAGPLGEIARWGFSLLRASGDDIRELLHDGHPTACVGTSAFAYVNAFTAHVNLGFFFSAPNSTIPPACWKARAATCGTSS